MPRKNAEKIMCIFKVSPAEIWETEILIYCVASSLIKDFSSAWRTMDSLELPPVMNVITFFHFREIPEVERATERDSHPRTPGLCNLGYWTATNIYSYIFILDPIKVAVVVSICEPHQGRY